MHSHLSSGAPCVDVELLFECTLPQDYFVLLRVAFLSLAFDSGLTGFHGSLADLYYRPVVE